MKYCTNCGTQLEDNVSFCPNCGTPVNAQPAPQPAAQPAQTVQTEKKFTGLQTVAFVFMILSTIAMGWTLIPLAWCIPMTVSYYNCIKQGRPVGMGLKVCTLLFVSLISGILMLVDSDT